MDNDNANTEPDVIGFDVTPEPYHEPEPKPEPGAKNDPYDNYERIFDSQQKQIDMLIKQNESLQGQISKLVSSGAQIDSGIEYKEPEPDGALPEDYVPLADLGKELFKKD